MNNSFLVTVQRLRDRLTTSPFRYAEKDLTPVPDPSELMALDDLIKTVEDQAREIENLYKRIAGLTAPKVKP